MKFLYNYNENTINYDLLNKFIYNSINVIPKLKFININLSLKTNNLKLLISYLAAFKLITKQNGVVVIAKNSNITFKVRKGTPIGCKIVLRKTKMFLFYLYLFNKSFLPLNKNKLSKNLFSFQIKNIFLFKDLELNYQFFNNLDFFNVNIVTATICKNQNKFFLNSYKIYRCIRNSMGECNLAKVKVKGSNPFVCFYIFHYWISGRVV